MDSVARLGYRPVMILGGKRDGNVIEVVNGAWYIKVAVPEDNTEWGFGNIDAPDVYTPINVRYEMIPIRSSLAGDWVSGEYL